MPDRQPVREESLWFGASDRPLFGRLTMPVDDLARGGVLLAAPLGRESRLSRRALRSLAYFLAMDGYVSLRFDHFGTGDSGGSIEDDQLDRFWVEGVVEGVKCLRSLGVSTISAVGMRMGATIIGVAASTNDLELSSFVMWDPSESAHGYARELSALGALRRDVHAVGLGEATKMLEYPLSVTIARRIEGFTLTEPSPRLPAERVMIILRDDRTASNALRSRWEAESVVWAATSEQAALLETELPDSVQPASTIAQIREWLTTVESPLSPFSPPTPSREALVTEDGDATPVHESVIELGRRSMFGILTEPVGEVRGPLVVMVNGINEDHVGPARLWVDSARKWAGLGLRCLRFDFAELGESPWTPGQPDRTVFDWTQRYDVIEAVRALIPENSDETILVGLCSGAQVALEAAMDLRALGLYAINPQVGAGVLRSADRLRNSDREVVRTSAHRFERLLKGRPWIDDLVQRLSRLVLLSAFSPKVRSSLAKTNSEMLLILGPNDLSPFTRIPVVGSLVGHRLTSSENIHVEVVPGLDHDFLSTLGRRRAVEILDRHIAELCLGAPVYSS
jgi:pimeloyl-ACP methyl ester carboxylesterase